MRKIIAVFTVLVFFTQPLYGLAPQEPDWGSMAVAALASTIAKLKDEKDPQKRLRIQSEAEGLLAQVKNTQKVTPYWDTLVFNEDESFEIVINYITVRAESRVVTHKFIKENDTYKALPPNTDVRLAYYRIARGALGLDFSRVGVPPETLEEVRNVGLPKALAYTQETLLVESPDAFAYRRLVTEEKPIQEVLGVVREAQDRIGKPIKAVVVLGIGGQSLGNRAVVQMLGSQQVRFIFPDNIANPNRWFSELEGVDPEEVLLYVSSKTGSTDETMANFWFFWEWLIQRIDTAGVAASLLVKLQNVNLVTGDLDLTKEERSLLGISFNHIVVSTTDAESSPIYNFAVKNRIPIVPIQTPVQGRYTVLFRSGQFTTALAGHDIEGMRQVLVPLAESFKEDNPDLNPALEAAMYAYALRRPFLAAVSSDRRLTPLFEWTRQLVNESLGKEGKGPYLTFAAGKEQSKELMSAPKDKLFLVINIGEEKLDIPKGVSAIEINIPEINQETLARVFLFLEEFTVRYGTLLGVNPVGQPWVDRFKKILKKTAKGFDTSPQARERRKAEAKAVKEISVTGGVESVKLLESQLTEITQTDMKLTVSVQVPEGEESFQALQEIGKQKLQDEKLENSARNIAMQIYTAEKLGKSVNPFFIYSASPEARLLGEFIKYLGQRRIARLAEYGGSVLWDYLIGTTDQYLAAGNNDMVFATFMQFLQEPEKNPPIVSADVFVDKRLENRTPKEISTLYMQSVRQALNNEGRLTNTINVPNEEEESLLKLYQLLARANELYSRLVESENKGGTTLNDLVQRNESTTIKLETGVTAGTYGKESPEKPKDLSRTIVPMTISGVSEKTFINPKPQDRVLSSEVTKGFYNKVNLLARVVARLRGIKGSALNWFAGQDIRKNPKPEFYAFRLEDTIAKVEVGSEVSDTLWQEINIRAANTMIAKTVQEIKRINPQAKVVVYTEDTNLTETRIKAALNAIDSGGVFDLVVCGDFGKVLGEIVSKNWAKSHNEAIQKTIFASAQKIDETNIKSVNVQGKIFTPFPELATVMQAMLNLDETQGLPIDRIIESYSVWLELSGFNREEINSYSETLRTALQGRTGLIVTLPIPPTPKAGSVIELLDREYNKTVNTRSYA